MVRKRKSTRKSKSAASCSILKKRISTAKNKTSRGKALGAFAKAGCARRKKRRRS